jgi:tRNA A37 threonylcarbamoyladenosine modification protein TsaB
MHVSNFGQSNPFLGPWENFVLLLTHRRGGIALAVNRSQLIGKELPFSHSDGFVRFSESIVSQESWPAWQSVLADAVFGFREVAHKGTEPLSVCVAPGLALALSRATTAEYLSEMYLRVLNEMSLKENQVENLVLGTGPGSFTGLRIGCAFANGLSRGRKRSLFGVPCISLHELRAATIALGIYDAWKTDFAVLELGKDESFAPIGLLDVIAALAKMATGEARVAAELEPFYGKEPGPVIKLRAQEAQEKENGNG